MTKIPPNDTFIEMEAKRKFRSNSNRFHNPTATVGDPPVSISLRARILSAIKNSPAKIFYASAYLYQVIANCSIRGLPIVDCIRSWHPFDFIMVKISAFCYSESMTSLIGHEKI